ncbi:MAG TPA: hypothetical protein VFC63_12860 [Blastocatellia bacterium]|nr:hypothetical protein [Blastocatellia bacterium]
MTEPSASLSFNSVPKLELSEIDLLPYGLLEVNPDGTVIEYIPFRSQITSKDLPQVCGLNLFQDILPETILAELQDLLPSLVASPNLNQNRLLILPFPERTVRLSVVAAKNQNSPRIRISLVRLSGSPTTINNAKTRTAHKTQSLLN